MDFLKDTLDLLWSPTAIIVGCIIVFCLLNIKSLPFFWHIRLLSAFIQHSRGSKTTTAASALRVFSSLVTRTRCSVLEMDYVLHKSNSTYFTDLDISRVHLLLFLFQSGIAKLQRDGSGSGSGSGQNARVMPVLGGVSATFRRAIKPGDRYEVVSRVLSWDDKWIYIGSWFVAPGTFARGAGGSSGAKGARGAAAEQEAATSKPATRRVYASAVTKYVIKAGKVTVPPAKLLVASGLLPDGDGDGDGEEAKGARARIEAERLRALPYGRALGELDGVLGEVAELGGYAHMPEFFRDLL